LLQLTKSLKNKEHVCPGPTHVQVLGCDGTRSTISMDGSNVLWMAFDSPGLIYNDFSISWIFCQGPLGWWALDLKRSR
jgi:hypothetical protein